MLRQYRIHVLDGKLEADVVRGLYDLAETNGATIAPVSKANVVLTAIHARKRLQRHLDIDEALARGTALVTPQWLSDSAAQGVALPFEPYQATKQHISSRVSSEESLPEASRLQLRHVSSEASPTRPITPVSTFSSGPWHTSPSEHKTGNNDSAPSQSGRTRHSSDNSRFATHRLSPLVCPNQSLLLKIGVIMRSRALDGNARSALSYSRAISVLKGNVSYYMLLRHCVTDSNRGKAHPHVIRGSNEVSKLPGIGKKIEAMIDEYLMTGDIVECREIEGDARYQALELFASIYSIGPTTARHLYDDLGIETLADLEAYAEQLGDDDPSARNMKVALGYREEFLQKIPRDEVEKIALVIKDHLDAIAPGTIHTICGGYRRGKPVSNDVDIIVTHPDRDRFKGLCARLVQRLQQAGIVTHVLHMSSFTSEHGAIRSRKFGSGRQTHFDSLDKGLTVFRMPIGYEPLAEPERQARPSIGPPADSDSSIEAAIPNENSNPVPIGIFDESTPHRRLDLIFAPPEAYWTAVVGWTGSTQFERDIRLWAKQTGLHFDSTGICRQNDTAPIFAHSEREVFDILGLQYVEPQWRNADL